MAGKLSSLHIGCGGFGCAQAEYFRTFSCVEIDSSFYQLPKLATAARWSADAPAGFTFALKAWQVITHRASSPTYKHTRLDVHDAKHAGHFGFNATVRWAWDETYKVAQALHAGVVLFQCPASFTPTGPHVADLKHFFERAKRGKLLFAWEPRGTWEPALITELCRELELIHVVDPFQTPALSSPKTQYFRLRGVTGAQHRYTDEELRRLRGFCQRKAATYCFFHTRAMVADAQRFRVIAGLSA